MVLTWVDEGLNLRGPSGLAAGSNGPVRVAARQNRLGLDGAYSAFQGVGFARGRLLLAWRQGTDHVNARDGYIRVCYSDDLGRTWSAPVTAVPYPGGGLDMRDVSVGASRDGSTFYLSYFKGRSSNPALGCFLRTSTDGGVTWSAERRIDPNAPYAGLSGPLVEAPNGALTQPWYGRSGSETRDSVWVARSTDGGTTWSSTRIVNGQTAGRDYQEPFIARCDDTLVMLFRWGNNDSIGVTRSTNNGATWSTPTVAFSPGTGRPAAVWLSTGALLCIYRRGSDGAAVYRSSRDRGGTWTQPRLMMPVTGSGWMTYADGIETSPGLAFTTLSMEHANGTAARLWNSYSADGPGLSPLGDSFPDPVVRAAADVDTILAVDDFDRPDTTAAAGLGWCLTGQPWSAGGRIEGGTARCGVANFVPEFPVVQCSTPDVTVEADMLWTGDPGYALILRYRDDNNHFMYTIEGGSAVRFYVRNNGTYYPLSSATSVPVAAGPWRRWRAVIRGDRFLGFVDDQLILAYNIGEVDTNLLGAQTRHGLKFNESGSVQHRCRRFIVRS